MWFIPNYLYFSVALTGKAKLQFSSKANSVLTWTRGIPRKNERSTDCAPNGYVNPEKVAYY